ncbi:MAG: hypothetical protein JXJ22_17910 [Bacteroidales bacterium]|nr:hypothetical protein [Bacteroidales bacterium]
MRLWSLHPQYLDRMGLVALWREALLAKNVLSGNTRGYKSHPQLYRFKNSKNPLYAINRYLHYVYVEALERKYKFDKGKIDREHSKISINVTRGQLKYEKEHLLRKLDKRDKIKFSQLVAVNELIPHPMFVVVDGGVEDWEVI